MAFLDWLKVRKNKNQDVKVVKVKEESIGIGEMAAGHPTGAAAAIKRMMDQKNGPTKVLVVGDGCFSDKLSDYSLKMAQRLDCAIVALNVTDAPLQYSDERREAEINLFYARAERNLEKYLEQANVMGVHVVHIMEIGDQEKAISELSAKDSGIRYVLTEPDHGGEEGRVQIPVFDLACSRL